MLQHARNHICRPAPQKGYWGRCFKACGIEEKSKLIVSVYQLRIRSHQNSGMERHRNLNKSYINLPYCNGSTSQARQKALCGNGRIIYSPPKRLVLIHTILTQPGVTPVPELHILLKTESSISLYINALRVAAAIQFKCCRCEMSTAFSK